MFFLSVSVGREFRKDLAVCSRLRVSGGGWSWISGGLAQLRMAGLSHFSVSQGLFMWSLYMH